MPPNPSGPEMQSRPGSSPTGFYVISGTLPLDAPSYVERQADRDLFDALHAGEYCFVLHSRQMGKSSLAVRCMQRLQHAGVRTVFLDLQRFGGASVTPEQWYIGLLSETGRALGLRREMLACWKEHADFSLVERFFGALREVVLAGDGPKGETGESPSPHDSRLTTHDSRLTTHDSPLVVFVDEVDAVKSLPFPADEFFAAARECYNRRVQDGVFCRLTFCLVGSAMPSDLIADTRTSPFNVGRRIEIKDFTEAEALALAEGLNRPNAEALVRRVFYWTGGQPHLTQAVCAEMARREEVRSPQDVDRLVGELYFVAGAREKNANLADVSNRMLSSYLDAEQREEHRAAVLDLYGKVLRGRVVADDETSRMVGVLKLSGVVRSVGGRLVVRNRIYERVFDRAWIRDNMPDAELRRQKAAFRKGLLRATAIAGVIILAMGALIAAVVRQRNLVEKARRDSDRNAALAREETLTSRRHLYAANMALAQQAWQAHDFERVKSLLEELIPAPGQVDVRGFEWHLLWRRGYFDLPILPEETRFSPVVFSPDGKVLATLNKQSLITLWDAGTGRKIRSFGKRQDQWGLSISALTFSPDGRALAVGLSTEGAETKTGGVPHIYSVNLWDVATGRLLRSFQGYQGPLAFSPDGRSLAVTVGSLGSKVVILDMATGRARQTLTMPVRFVDSCAFSPDGRLLALGGRDGRVELREAATGNLLRLVEPAHAGQELNAEEFASVAFSPDGKRLAVGQSYFSEDPRGAQAVVKVWDMATGRLTQVLRGAQGPVAFFPDGKTLATGYKLSGNWMSRDTYHSIVLWDLPTGRMTARLIGARDAMAFSPDGARLATDSYGWGGGVKLWDMTAPREPLLLKGSDCRAVVSPDGRTLATRNWSDYRHRAVLLWDMATGRLLHRMAGDEVLYFFSPDGRTLATNRESTLLLRDVATGKALQVLPGIDRPLCFSSDGRKLFVATHVKVLRAYLGVQTQLKMSNTALANKGVGIPGEIKGSPVQAFEGRRILVHLEITAVVKGSTAEKAGLRKGDILLKLDGREPGTSERLREQITKHAPGDLVSLVLFRNGQTLSQSVRLGEIADEGRSFVAILNTGTWKMTPVPTLENAGNANNARLSPDGKTLALANDRNDSVMLWNVETGQLRRTLRETAITRYVFGTS